MFIFPILIVLQLLPVKMTNADSCSNQTYSPPCQPRKQVVDLMDFLKSGNTSLSNGILPSEVVQLIPRTMERNVCSGGGGCRSPLSCGPIRMSVEEVEVMAVLAKWPTGEHKVSCTTLQVIEETECQCQCERKNCVGKNQTFDQKLCRCGCSNVEEKSSCISQGRHCTDPASLTSCSTGYIFDITSQCSCVQVSTVANPGIVAGLLISSLALLMAAVAGVSLHRAGLRPQCAETYAKKESLISTRVRLMSQKSRSEFDLLKATASSQPPVQYP